MSVIRCFATLGLFASLAVGAVSCAWEESTEDEGELSQAYSRTTTSTKASTVTTVSATTVPASTTKVHTRTKTATASTILTVTEASTCTTVTF